MFIMYREQEDFQSVQVFMNKSYHFDKPFKCSKIEQQIAMFDVMHLWQIQVLFIRERGHEKNTEIRISFDFKRTVPGTGRTLVVIYL